MRRIYKTEIDAVVLSDDVLQVPVPHGMVFLHCPHKDRPTIFIIFIKLDLLHPSVFHFEGFFFCDIVVLLEFVFF